MFAAYSLKGVNELAFRLFHANGSKELIAGHSYWALVVEKQKYTALSYDGIRRDTDDLLLMRFSLFQTFGEFIYSRSGQIYL